MNNKFDISVITPTLNAEKYISRCIASLISQEKVKVQHIIVDGGSKDKTLEISKNFNFSEVYILENSSIYSALNYGAKLAKAEILYFLNSDDTVTSKNIFSEIHEAFKRKNDLSIIYGNCRFINKEEKLIYKLISPSKLDYEIAKKRVFNISHPSWFIKKDDFNLLNGYNPELKFIADCDLIIRAIENNLRFFYLNLDISNFLLHENNASSTISAKNEFKKYRLKNKKNNVWAEIEYIYIFTKLYAKDLNYFFYKLNKLYKYLTKGIKSFISLKYKK